MSSEKRWLVICFASNDYTICHDEQALARQVGRLWRENVKREGAGALPYPIEVYELGQKVSVTLKEFEIQAITPEHDS
ncbi:MAG TPA: hypothetical protein VEA41_23195 [Salinarimonas sp.]|nr:hypothetical protein [Salinarimonas sp.]